MPAPYLIQETWNGKTYYAFDHREPMRRERLGTEVLRMEVSEVDANADLGCFVAILKLKGELE